MILGCEWHKLYWCLMNSNVIQYFSLALSGWILEELPKSYGLVTNLLNYDSPGSQPACVVCSGQQTSNLHKVQEGMMSTA